MIYYTKNPENYLRDGWKTYPKEYRELNEEIKFPFVEHFTSSLTIPDENFIWFFELRHPFILKNLDKYVFPLEIVDAIKKKTCKILVLGWMENWGIKEFKILFEYFSKQIPDLEYNDFIYATASAEDYSNEKFNHFYANRMERQWHEIFYPKIVRKAKKIKKIKDFICLNRRPAWHRFLTVSLLWEWRRLGHISHLAKDSKLNDDYYGTETAENHYTKAFDVFKSCDPFPHTISKKFTRQVEKALPMILKQDRHKILEGANPNKDTDAPKYLESWIHIVTETRMETHTEMDGLVDRFVSEKTFKPMFYKQPFIIVGQYKILESLRKWGYKTYGTFFNEEYDNTKNGFFRTQKAIQNMQRWLSLTPAGKEAMYKEHEHVFEHNFNHLMKRGKELEKNLHEHIQGVFK